MLKQAVILAVLTAHLFTFGTAQQARAAVPLAIYAASAIGAAMAASATGQYYAKTGHAPEYVSAVAGAAASASDLMFQPSILAAGPISLVTAASFPNMVQAYIGKEAAVGSRLSDLIGEVTSAAVGTYDDLSVLLAQRKGAGSGPVPSDASVIDIPGEELHFRLGSSNWTQYTSENAVPAAIKNGKFVSFPGPFDGTYSKWMWMSYDGTYVYVCRTDQWLGGPYVIVDRYTGTRVSGAPTYVPPAGSYDFSGLKADLAAANMSAGVADDFRKAIARVPPAAQVKAADVPSAGTGEPPVALTASDIQAALATNTAAVAEAVKTAADDRLAADPTNTALQQAADQAAADLAKAQQAAQEEVVKEEGYAATTPALAEIPAKEIDFGPIKSLTGDFSKVFPFGLIGSIVSPFSSLSAAPVTPSFTIDLGIHQREVTFTSFDGFASIIRSILSFLMYCLTAFFCFKLYART